MLEYLFSLSLLIFAVIIIRALCKKRVSAKLVYAMWLAVIIRLIIPVNLINLDLPFPEVSEIGTAILERIDEGTPMEGQDLSFEIPVSSEALPIAPVTPEVQKDTTVTPENAPIADSVTAETLSPNTIKLDAEELLLYAWGFGSLITLFFFAVPFVITGIRLKRSRRYHSKSGNTKVYVSDKVSSPCVMGIVPTIYITPSAESCKALELIILHEKTHIRHADHLWAILRIALIISFWWNPFVWAAALLSKRDAEVACDESVVRTMDDARRITYGRLILDMIPQKGGFVVAFANKPIKYRILRLTGKYKTTIIAAVVAVLTITLCFVMAFISNGVDDGENTILHFHKFSEKATCTASARCACGDVKGKPLGHKWVDADCENPKTCTRCSLTDGIPLEHTWLEATCDSAKTCTECKVTMGEHLEHIWISATCTADEYCSLCRDTRQKALGHDFTEATCTTAKTCNRCNYTDGNAVGHTMLSATCINPETCDLCGYTEGNALGHKWTEATCTKSSICTTCKAKGDNALGHSWIGDGCTSKKICSHCNFIESEALGHNYDRWVCTRCKGLEPDFAKKVKSAQDYLDSLNGIEDYWLYSDLYHIYGYTEAEANRIIEVMNVNWYAQAEKRAWSFISQKEGNYSKQEFYDFLHDYGFETYEVDYAFSVVSKVNPPRKVETYSDYADFSTSMSGDWEFADPWHYTGKPDFGNDISKPIRWDYAHP